VLTNMLLPYALTQITETQMTADGMPAAIRELMDPDRVAPVLTALASPECRLNGEYIVTGGGGVRRLRSAHQRLHPLAAAVTAPCTGLPLWPGGQETL
jgi:hypothetical protein